MGLFSRQEVSERTILSCLCDWARHQSGFFLIADNVAWVRVKKWKPSLPIYAAVARHLSAVLSLKLELLTVIRYVHKWSHLLFDHRRSVEIELGVRNMSPLKAICPLKNGNQKLNSGCRSTALYLLYVKSILVSKRWENHFSALNFGLKYLYRWLHIFSKWNL